MDTLNEFDVKRMFIAGFRPTPQQIREAHAELIAVRAELAANLRQLLELGLCICCLEREFTELVPETLEAWRRETFGLGQRNLQA